MIRYKGYVGVMEVDPDANLIHGDVIGLRDVITFQCQSVPEATQAFRESVDDYLAWCAAKRRAPEKTFNGKIMVRLDPAIHRSLCQLAESRSTSVNKLAVEALVKLANDCESETKIEQNDQGQTVSNRKGRRNTQSSGTAKTGAAARKPRLRTKP
jgi:predicted HicB family RNase H-like nuclease